MNFAIGVFVLHVLNKIKTTVLKFEEFLFWISRTFYHIIYTGIRGSGGSVGRASDL